MGSPLGRHFREDVFFCIMAPCNYSACLRLASRSGLAKSEKCDAGLLCNPGFALWFHPVCTSRGSIPRAMWVVSHTCVPSQLRAVCLLRSSSTSWVASGFSHAVLRWVPRVVPGFGPAKVEKESDKRRPPDHEKTYESPDEFSSENPTDGGRNPTRMRVS